MGQPWDRTTALAGIATALIALVGVVVALLTWLLPQQAGLNELSQQPHRQPGLLDESIDPISYKFAAWSSNSNNTAANQDELVDYEATYAHVFGDSTGRFVYQTNIGEFTGKDVELTARLSANVPWYRDPDNNYSDVTVKVNGTPLPSQQVVPDDARGERYTWSFPSELLKKGLNTIEFLVEEDAEYPNGICIYGKAVAPGNADEQITLQSHQS